MQETTTAVFSPQEFGYDTWTDYLILGCFALVICAAWWWFSRFIERYRARIPWRTVSFIWPTMAVAIGGTLIALEAHLQTIPDVLIGPLLIVYFALFLPAFVGAALAGGLLSGSVHGWGAFTIMGAAAWISCFGTARLLEWRAWQDAPISLNLRPDEATTSKDNESA